MFKPATPTAAHHCAGISLAGTPCRACTRRHVPAAGLAIQPAVRLNVRQRLECPNYQPTLTAEQVAAAQMVEV